MEQKTRLSGRVAARITSRAPALGMQEHRTPPLRNCLHPVKATERSEALHRRQLSAPESVTESIWLRLIDRRASSCPELSPVVL